MRRRNAFSGPSPEELRHHTHIRSVHEWLYGLPSEAEMDSVHLVNGMSDAVSSSRVSDSDRSVALETIAEEPEDEGIDIEGEDVGDTSDRPPTVANTSNLHDGDLVAEASTSRLSDHGNCITAFEMIAEELEDADSSNVVVIVGSQQDDVDIGRWTRQRGTRRRTISDDESS